MAKRAIKIPYEFIKDPIYGYIKLYEHEKEIIDTPIFQRLRRIKQLASAPYVYPGATHDRFSHSLGVMHISGLFISQILEPYVGKEISNYEFQQYFLLLRLWGLTHDLGHGPFSHIFDDVVLRKIGLNHEYMSSKILIISLSSCTIFEKKLRKINISPGKLAECLGKSREEWVSTKTLGKTEHTDAAFYQILKGFYSTDIIDYLLRDNYYTGAGYSNFDWQRLIFSSHLHQNEIALEKKARDSLDALLLSRLFSFNTIYYHRWSRAIDHVIKNFLSKSMDIIDYKEYVDDIRKYAELDEQSLLLNPKLKKIPERSMLINRLIPYRMMLEERVNLSERPRHLAFIDSEYLSYKFSEILRDKVPKEAYFVDTSNLDLNPMVEEEEVCLIDTTTSPPSISHELIRKTSWGEIPRSTWIIRLYLDNRYKRYEKTLKTAYGSLGKYGRTHF